METKVFCHEIANELEWIQVSYEYVWYYDQYIEPIQVCIRHIDSD